MTARLNAFFAGLVAVGALGALAIAAGRQDRPLLVDKAGKPFTVQLVAVVDEITGRAIAIDGDTIIVGQTHVRLAEIDAPERRQTCLDAQKASYACGEAATRAMRYMLARDPIVTCTVRATDRYGRTVAACRNSGGDLAGRLVALGWAIVWPRYSTGAYDDQQSAAKAERAGMWSGEFTAPWDYRHQH